MGKKTKFKVDEKTYVELVSEDTQIIHLWCKFHNKYHDLEVNADVTKFVLSIKTNSAEETMKKLLTEFFGE